ncbi:MAG: DUF4288 domain-containing protein [Candidatus Acidiferrales bacterium]
MADFQWYLAELIMEITVSGAARNVVHRNLTLVRARSADEAHEKAVGFGYKAETTYDNPAGQQVLIAFRGLGSLEEMYEPLEDGAELTFEEFVSVPREEIESWIPPKEKLSAFGPPKPGREHDPDYRSAELMRKAVEQLGRSRQQE